MLRIGARKAEFRLQRNAVRDPSVKTLLDRVLRRIDEIIYKLEFIVVPCILDRENLLENLIQPLVLSVLGGGFELEEILEGFQLNLQKIRVVQDFGLCEVDSLILGLS